MNLEVTWVEETKDYTVRFDGLYFGTIEMIDGGIMFVPDIEPLSCYQIKKLSEYMNNMEEYGTSK